MFQRRWGRQMERFNRELNPSETRLIPIEFKNEKLSLLHTTRQYGLRPYLSPDDCETLWKKLFAAIPEGEMLH